MSKLGEVVAEVSRGSAVGDLLLADLRAGVDLVAVVAAAPCSGPNNNQKESAKPAS